MPTRQRGQAPAALRVQGRLFLRRGKRPRRPRAALLAKDEAQLLRRLKLSIVRAERRTRLLHIQCTEHVPAKVTFLTGHLWRCRLRRPFGLLSLQVNLPPARFG